MGGIQIDVRAVLKGIALIEKATKNPLAKAALLKVLPGLGVPPEAMAQLDAHHEDYQKWLADAEQRADPPATPE